MPGKYGILKTTAIDWGKYSPLKNQEVLDDYKVNLKHEVRTGDILITKAGPVHRVGVVAYVEKTPSNMLVSGKMTLLRAQKDHDPRYLSYALSTDYSQKPLKESTTGMAASQTNFTHDTLLSIPIWVPGSLPEQQKIAAILSSVDDVIEKTRAQIDKLKDLKTGMMQELLTKGIGHTAFKDSPVGRIPEGWEVKALTVVAENYDSKRVPIKSVDRAGMQGGYRYYGASGIIDYVNDYIFDGTFILLGEDGENVLSRHLPLAFIVEGKFWVNNHAHVLKAKDGMDTNYLCEYLESIDYKNIASGSAQPKITQSSLSAILIPVPSLEEQKAISQTLSSADARIRSTSRKMEQLALAKKALMQDLLTGKVRVNVDNKENAVA